MTILPRKVKHRKFQKGRSLGRTVETRGTSLNFGNFGLKALEYCWISGRQLDASRKSMLRFIKKKGKIWMRVFPDKPVTRKPPEVTMGGGKGAVDHYVTVVRPGRMIFEIDGLSKDSAVEALKLAASKLPMRTAIVEK